MPRYEVWYDGRLITTVCGETLRKARRRVFSNFEFREKKVKT